VLYFAAGDRARIKTGALLKKMNAQWYNLRNGKRADSDKTAEGTLVAIEKNDWVLLLQKAQESKQINVK